MYDSIPLIGLAAQALLLASLVLGAWWVCRYYSPDARPLHVLLGAAVGGAFLYGAVHGLIWLASVSRAV